MRLFLGLIVEAREKGFGWWGRSERRTVPRWYRSKNLNSARNRPRPDRKEENGKINRSDSRLPPRSPSKWADLNWTARFSTPRRSSVQFEDSEWIAGIGFEGPISIRNGVVAIMSRALQVLVSPT